MVDAKERNMSYLRPNITDKNIKSHLTSHLIYEGGGRQVDQPLNRATTPLILTPKKRNINVIIKE